MRTSKPRRNSRPTLESLDERVVPASMFSPVHTAVMTRAVLPMAWTPTVPSYSVTPTIPIARAAVPTRTAVVPRAVPASQDPLPKSSPLNRLGGDLAQLYQTFLAGGDTSSFAGSLRIEGDRVGVDVRPRGSLAALTADLRAMGMTIEHIDARTQTVEGMIPIAQLGTLASAASVSSVNPIYRPITAGIHSSSGYGLALAGRIGR